MLEDEERIAIEAWNLMGGTLDWSALPLICEIYDVHDVERLIVALAAIRDGLRTD